MRFNEFIGPTYQLRSLSVECQRCVNLYPEIDELGTEKDRGIAALVSTPGLRVLNDIVVNNNEGQIRGAYVAQNNVLYVVSGHTLFAIAENWQAFEIGNIGQLSGNSQVTMSDNGQKLMIADPPNAYFCDLAAPGAILVLTPMSDDPNWKGTTMTACADGMFVFNVPGKFQFYVTLPVDPNDPSVGVVINDLSEQALQTPDNIIGFVWDKRNLWFFCQRSIELWYNTGAGAGIPTGNPFQIIQGGYIECGCAAAFSIVQLANTVIWLGQDPRGNGVVYMANGYSPQRISNHSVEISIQSYGDLSNAVAWTYQQDGHEFYAINFPTANTTWVFDLLTGMWHERTFTVPSTGLQARHRAQVHAFAYGTHVVGDYQDGKIYELDQNTFTDNGNPISRLRAATHISEDMDRIFFHKFQLDFQPGVGLDGDEQGSNPQAMMQFSDNGGYTWSNEMWVSLGKLGELTKRAIWRRLGQGRNRVFRVKVTDPVDITMIGAEIDATKGTS